MRAAPFAICAGGSSFRIPIESLIQIALENNQDLQVAISKIFQFYDNLVVVGSALSPANLWQCQLQQNRDL